MTPQKTSDVVEESRCLPHLPNEILVMIFDRMIAGAAAGCQPITWEICHSQDPQRLQLPGRVLQDDVTAYSQRQFPHLEDTKLVSSRERFNNMRLPLQVCSWTRAMALKIFHPLRYRSQPYMLPRVLLFGERMFGFSKEDCVWACPALDVFWIINDDVEIDFTQPWPCAQQSSDHHASSSSQPSATDDGILRVIQNVRFDWLSSNIPSPGALSGALEWSLSLPSIERVYVDKHLTHPSYGAAGYLKTGHYRLGSRKRGPEYLHLVGLPDWITCHLQRPTTDKAQWKALRSRKIPVVVRDPSFSDGSDETVPLELFLDEKDEICFRLFCR
ncbi:hypothetical protein CCUS01_01771 [Colletotrichum cuscutae]|uniref:Uncharacterized protein n=1 Tax=Colletotrichum cuscutae TaxID=1209917 RepID=A0AAI9XR87_9PEZI|nr:hypothetical protein CCUS01_01771 [Colletotrichum cuscutae]